jgi:hypothetical protein
MAVQEHLELLRLGTPEWNRWRKQNASVVPDLSSAHLQKVRLSGADLSGAKFAMTYFGDADLTGANLEGADLSRARMPGADLRGAHLRGVNLTDTDLRSATLSGADLCGAIAVGTNLACRSDREPGLRGRRLECRTCRFHPA